jgi:hypothetical protein
MMVLALIERLPVELIQPIFVLSGCNVALPQVSNPIAIKLSAKWIYDDTCTQHLTQHPTTYHDDRRFQSQQQTHIFACKWMTWEYFKNWVMRRFGDNGCLCGKTKKTGCFDPIWPPHFEDATGMVYSRSHLPAIAWVTGRLPVKLLHGPWNEDKVQFLRFLLWTTAMTVNWADSEVLRLTREGRREALITRNLEVVELFNHNRRLGRWPTLESVRLAVFEGGCDRSIVYDLMLMARTSGVGGDDWTCVMLDAWCEEKIAAGDPKGTWLQTKLKELRVTYEPGNGDWQNGTGKQGAKYGHMDSKTGDYEDVDGDKLVIHQHRWNLVSDIIFLF